MVLLSSSLRLKVAVLNHDGVRAHRLHVRRESRVAVNERAVNVVPAARFYAVHDGKHGQISQVELLAAVKWSCSQPLRGRRTCWAWNRSCTSGAALFSPPRPQTEGTC